MPNNGGVRVSGRLEAVTVLVITAIICANFLVAYVLRWLLTAFAGNSLGFELPWVVRGLGGLLVLLGLFAEVEVMRVRKPREVLDSTAVTLVKIARRLPMESSGGRTEPFIPRGVYCWVRNPMYFGVVLVLLGFGVLFDSATVLLWWALVTCYFVLFIIPREEKELDTLFEGSYRDYKRQVPMLFPTGRRFRGQRDP